MEHLTNFELVLTGACITTFCFGFHAFVRDEMNKELKSRNLNAIHEMVNAEY
jgi:hypothetical protein